LGASAIWVDDWWKIKQTFGSDFLVLANGPSIKFERIVLNVIILAVGSD